MTSEKKMQIVIDNYFKSECDVDTSIRDAFEKGFRIGVQKTASAEAVQGYTEWLEKIIVEAETFEWLCEDTTDEEWCEKNCNYASIQAECLRHLYEVSKGGDTE